MKMLNPKHARDELKDILSKREYRIYYNQSKSWLEIWWEKAKQWIADKLAKWFPSFEAANGAAVPVLIALIVVVVLLLALTLFFIFRNVKRNRILRNQKPLQSITKMNWTFKQHLSEARKQELLQEYTLSTRHLFLAVLLYFHDKGWLEARIWKTNFEYYEELRKINRDYADHFYKLAHFFDEVTYGERTVGKEEYFQFRAIAMKWLENDSELLGEKGGGIIE